MSAQARAFFDEGRYFQAAQCYSQCSVSFEEVALKFLDAGERDALRSYLISRLERTRKSVRFPLLPDIQRSRSSLFCITGLDAADDVSHLAGRILSEQV